MFGDDGRGASYIRFDEAVEYYCKALTAEGSSASSREFLHMAARFLLSKLHRGEGTTAVQESST